jgi:CBS domain-containing protein
MPADGPAGRLRTHATTLSADRCSRDGSAVKRCRVVLVKEVSRPPTLTADAGECVAELLERTSFAALPQYILVLDGPDPVGYVDSLTVALVGVGGVFDEEFVGNIMHPMPPPCRGDDDVRDARVVMDRSGAHLLAVVNARHRLVGWVHRSDLRSF